MKKEVILIIGLYFIMLISGGVLSVCQYKTDVPTGEFENNLYNLSGSRYIKPLYIFDFEAISKDLQSNSECTASFYIRNNIDNDVTIELKYKIDLISNGEIIQKINEEKTITIPSLKLININDTVSIPWHNGQCNILPENLKYLYVSNEKTISKTEEIKNQTCRLCGIKECINDGERCLYDFECGSNVCSQTGNTKGFCVSQRSEFEKRIYSLESNFLNIQSWKTGTDSWKNGTDSWKKSIDSWKNLSDIWRFGVDSWKNSLNLSISIMQSSLINLSKKVDFQNSKIITLESRIVTIENKPVINNTMPNYFKYLSSNDRKNIVCEYAKDNHLLTINDLGWICQIIYRNNPLGESSTCKCKKVE